MVKPAHTKISFSGTFGAPGAALEQWSFGFAFPELAGAATVTEAAIAAYANSVAGAYDGPITGIMGSDIYLTEVRVAAIGADGKTVKRANGTYVQGLWNGALPGSMAPQPVALQTALCVSLVTTRPGPTGKGRFYLPWPAASLATSDKRLPIAQAESLNSAISTFLAEVKTIMPGDLQVVSSKGYMSTVTGTRVGRLPDTQVRRRDDHAEGYVYLPLA